MIRIWILLLGITFIGAILRYVNLTPFTVYPDSFQNLLVAENIKTYGSVVGFLGKEGILFPDFFMWTRPMYALLIDAVSFFGISSSIAASSIAFIASIAAIPIAYLFTKAAWNQNNTLGVIGALFLALSYNHSVWSGMIMTESVGVFFMLLFLWRFFATVRLPTALFNWQDLFTGILFCFAVLTRYEYILIVLPLLFLTAKFSPTPYRYVGNVFGTFLVSLLFIGVLLFPFQLVIPVIINQFHDLLFRLMILLIIFTLVFLVIRFLQKRSKNEFPLLLPKIVRGIWITLTFYLLLQIILGQAVSFLYTDFSAIRNFVQHDVFLSLFAFMGILFMINSGEYILTSFVLFSIGILFFIYHQINPAMERYMTHLIPFLLLPASYGFIKLFQEMRKKFERASFIYKIFLLCIGFLLIFQLVLTIRGLRSLNDSSWYHPSYEQKAAFQVGKYVNGKPILLVSFPEPYYYFLHYDTQSITDTYPFLYIPGSLNNRTIVIIEDMGMHGVFPNFTKILHTKLMKYKIAEFHVNERYHYANNSLVEDSPIIIYKIRLGTLKQILSNK